MRIETTTRSASIRPRSAFLAFALLLLGTRVVSAQCTTYTDCLWPRGCGYSTPTGVPLPIPSPPVGIRNLVLFDVQACMPLFNVTCEVSLDNGLTWHLKQPSGNGSAKLSPTSPPGVNPALFDTELLQLDISGGGLPPGLMLRESPTKASTGQMHDETLGGGQFRIDNFFDVFFELSLDGGLTWMPSTSPTRLLLGTPQPTAVRRATWGELKSFYR